MTRVPADARARSFLSVLDFSAEELARCLDLAATLKAERGRVARPVLAAGACHVALAFDKPSLRTRLTFEIAIREIGGNAVILPPDVALGGRESAADVARNLERWVSGVVIRTYAQSRIVEFVESAPHLHVINALTDEEHPCQAVADFLTLREQWGECQGRTLAFIGDGNNVATSLAHAAALLGVHVRIASPDGYTLPERVVSECRRVARQGATLTLTTEPDHAVEGADAVYTDVWTSMGQEAESDRRRASFAAYQVNRALVERARPTAVVMHCLPARRGDEITAEVLESPASVVFDQAEIRLHAQKALLAMLLSEVDAS